MRSTGWARFRRYVPAGTLHGHRQFGGGPLEILDIHALTTVASYVPGGVDVLPEPIRASFSGVRPLLNAGQHSRAASEMPGDDDFTTELRDRAVYKGCLFRKVFIGP